VIAAVILLLFGARRIPELMRSLGSGTREFKKGMRGETDDEKPGETSTKTEKPEGDSQGPPQKP
jgi:sec-independent protein translocase protein TatA